MPVGGSKKRSMCGGSKKNSRWIAAALKKTKKGVFSSKARRAGMSTSAYACKMLRSPADSVTRKEAQMYVNMNRSRRC